MSEENDADSLQKFLDLLILLGTPRGEAAKKLQGITWKQLKGNPEIRKTIEELWASCENDKERHEEERRLKELKEERKRNLADLEKQLIVAQSQVEATEAEYKKLLEQRDEILKSLDTNQ